MTTDDDSVDPLLGTVLGNCRLEEVVGRGAMGAVYRATQEGLHRTVAVKVLWAELAANKKYVSRFERESRLIAQMRHPNVVDVYSAGVHGDHRFLVMEYVEGKPLSELIRERGALPPGYARGIMLQACHGLEAAWRHGVIHRDIKPDNLLVTPEGVVKVADFGLAKNVDEGTDLTRVGQIMGTPLYMSPEQAEGRKADIRADIYALGISFWHALAGRPPYQAETALALLRAHVDKPLPDVRASNPEVSDALWAVIQRMCAKDRDNRYADPPTLAAALEDPGAEVAGTVLDLMDDQPAGAQTIEDLPESVGLPAVAPDAETIHDPLEPAPGTATTTHGRSGSNAPLLAGAVAALALAGGGIAWVAGSGTPPAPAPAPSAAPTPAPAVAPPSAPVPAPAAVPDTTEEDYAKALGEAEAAIGDREWAAARESVSAALALKPGDPAAKGLIARIDAGEWRDERIAAAADAAKARAWQASLEAAQEVLDRDGTDVDARALRRAAEAQLALGMAMAKYTTYMKLHEYAKAGEAATEALSAVRGDPGARAAVRLAADALDASRALEQARAALANSKFDVAEERVVHAQRLYREVAGAVELRTRIDRARSAARAMAEAVEAAAGARWPAVLAALKVADRHGAKGAAVHSLRALAQRGVQLAAADAELPHANAKAVRRLLPNGVELLVLPAKVAHGQVRVSVAVRGAGSAHDRGPLSGTGIAALTRRLLSPAATAEPKRSRIEARGMLQALDAQVSGHDGKDHLRLGVTAPADNLEYLLRMVAAWVRSPTLPVADYHAVRDELRTMVYRRGQERWAIEWRQLSSAVWGAHPWSDEAEGSVPGLDRLTRRAVVDYHAAVFTPRRLVVMVAGDCDAAAALRLAGEAFGDWRGAAQAVAPLPPLPDISLPDRIQRAVKGLESATVFFAWRTVPAGHADRPALDAAASVLGRIAEFRLAEVVAAAEGRTAQARHWSEVQLPGLLYLGVRCAPGDVAAVEQGVAAAVHSLVERPPSPAELREATALVRPALPAGAAALEPLCADLLRTTLYADAPRFWTELPTRLRALKPDDVARVARDRLGDERRLTLVLLPAD